MSLDKFYNQTDLTDLSAVFLVALYMFCGVFQEIQTQELAGIFMQKFYKKIQHKKEFGDKPE